jgi:ligand-binding sensor domain-containing protein/signal transduction histidine kinase
VKIFPLVKTVFIFTLITFLLSSKTVYGQNQVIPDSTNLRPVTRQTNYETSFKNNNTSLPVSPNGQTFNFSHLTSQNGLPRALVLTILQDRQGFMWFGTMVGLVRYDGYDFKIYQHALNDPHSLVSNYIRSLYEDHTGTLWVGTNNGLDRYDPEKDRFVHYKHDSKDDKSLSNDLVFSILEDKNNNLWVGTKNGVNRFDRESGQFRLYKNDPQDPHSLAGSFVYSMMEDREKGQIWLGTLDGGISVLDETSGFVTRYLNDPKIPGSLSSNTVYSIYKDRTGSIWVGTNKGLDLFEAASQTFRRYQHDAQNPDSLIDDSVWMVYEDSIGRFWVTTSGGLELLNRQTGNFIHIQHDPDDPNSFSENNARYIYEDNTGAVWFSSVTQGINRLAGEPDKFTTIKNDPKDSGGLSSKQVKVMLVDQAGMLWMGTSQGVTRFDGQTFTQFLNDPNDAKSLSDNNIATIAQDAQGDLWIGTDQGNLNRLDGDRFRRYLPEPEDPTSLGGDGTGITFLYPDKQGGLWVGLGAWGVDYFDGQKFIHYRPDAAKSASNPTHFVIPPVRDLQGAFWLPGDEKGLVRFDPETKTFTSYLIDPEHVDSEINGGFTALYMNKDGVLWAGGAMGLIKFDPVSGQLKKQYTKSDGLPAESLAAIQEDSYGHLWLSTNKGLARLTQATSVFRNYDKADGLADDLFIEHSSAYSADGQMFFGSYSGVVSFYPDRLQDNPHVPPVVLTGFELFNAPVEIGGLDSPLPAAIERMKEITLRYDQSDFTFKFAALGYSSPEKNRYAYKMEGFDDEWRSTGANRRLATYTNLNPGSYTFRVKAANNDGVWNEQETSIKIIITPPWWGTWWFRSLVILGLLGLVLAVYRWRVRNLRQRTLELEREVAARVKELTESNKQLELAKEKAEATNQDLEAFVYSVSHDLRAPLRTIDTYSQVLQEEDSVLLDDVGKDYLKRIRSSTQHMAQLIEDLLKLARVTRAEMLVKNVDLCALAREVLNDLQMSQPDRQIEIVIPDSLFVQGDPNLLRVALNNLLSNAWKFTGKLQDARIELGCYDQDGKRVYFIKDNGAGFDMTYASKLFGAFQRLHSTSDFEGTGVGLTIVKRIMQRHGGTIWAEGIVDQGATFYFTLE